MVNKDELCGALIEKEGFWVCVWGSRDKPPVFQKLSKKLNEARKICDVCMASRLPKSHALARLYLITAAFKCNQCLEVNFYEQRQRRMIHPVECPKCGFEWRVSWPLPTTPRIRGPVWESNRRLADEVMAEEKKRGKSK